MDRNNAIALAAALIIPAILYLIWYMYRYYEGGAGCTADTDCPNSSQICASGRCIFPLTFCNPPCTGSQKCVNGACA